MRKLIVILVIAAIAAVGWFIASLRPVDLGDSSRSITVAQGASTAEIGGVLFREELIRSELAFRLYVAATGRDGALQAGTFAVSRAMAVPTLVDLLHTGKGQQAVVTIPEGYTVKEVDALLAERGFAEPGEILRCLRECDFSSFDFLPEKNGLAERGGRIEGYLFPETYYIEPANFVPKFFLERLLTTFRRRVLEDLRGEILASGRGLLEIVTMASLIEEESRTDDERRVVSDILWKRFDAKLGLGVDATVRYILDKPVGDITHADLNTNSPYNTRKFRDLPPGPIASPGIESIRAALNPKESAYWYYLHDRDGTIHYAVSNEEHNLNRYRYLGKE